MDRRGSVLSRGMPVDPPALNYLERVAQAGIAALIDNGAGLSMQLLHHGGAAIPVVVSDGASGKAAVFSPRDHYLEYPIHEIARSSSFWTTRRLRTALFPLAALLWAGRLDQVVYVNHWLIVGGPAIRLSRERLGDLVAGLIREYPQHALVFSGVVPLLDSTLTNDLIQLGGRAVQSRVVHLLDPLHHLEGRALRKKRATRRHDHAIWVANAARRVEDPEVLLRHVEAMQALYAQVYLEKYPRHLNPQYRSAFFRHVLQSGFFVPAGWLRDGALEAFNVQLIQDGVIRWSVCGYNRDGADGLFRLVAAEDVARAMREGLILNWGGGNDAFKRYRGAAPTFEYDVVFDRHLAPHRRFAWQALQQLRARKNGAPLVPRAP